MTQFAVLADLGERLSATRSRIALAELIAGFLRTLAPEDIAPATRLVIGRIFPEGDARTLNLSGQAVARVLERVIGRTQWDAGGAVDFGEAVQMVLQRAQHTPAGEPLSLPDVYSAFEQIASATGPGSRERKDELLEGLLRRATPVEAKYIVKTVVREMRHGVNEGIVLDGIARAAGVAPALARRANQNAGDLGLVASLALRDGAAGLERLPPRLGQPLKPMLAQTAANVSEALTVLGGAPSCSTEGGLALEYKLDGARVQIHKDGAAIRLFSRHLADLTESLPDIVAVLREHITSPSVILEGEVIAVSPQGRPLPFQHLMQRLGRVRDIADAVAATPTKLYLFDVLYQDGVSLLERPYSERWDVLEQVHGGIALAQRCVPATVADGERFLVQARRDGHEGVMAKSLTSTYAPGVRGGGWLKIKPVATLDLVIVAADWGYGRRHGWLSNYHLAARDEESGELLVVGKTFKGPTDEEFKAITARLLALKTSERRGTVTVRPEIVAEVAFNNIQRSPQYASGMALRFARIVRWRDDKPAAEADTLQTMRRLFAAEWLSAGTEEGLSAEGPEDAP